MGMTSELRARIGSFVTLTSMMANRRGSSAHALTKLEQVVAQPVRTCPQPNYLFKCNPENLAESGTTATTVTAAFEERLLSEEQKRAFLTKLGHSLRETEQLLESEECLREDLQ